MRHRLLVLAIMFVAVLGFGCSSVDEAVDEPVAEADHDGADTDAEEGGERDHGMEGDERAEYSKPDEVYAFLGVSEGDTVVDLMAGGGYNAERLAQLVGASGTVVVERGSEGFQERAIGGDLADYNFAFVGDVAEIEDGSVNAVIAVRAYHLFPDVPAQLTELYRAMAPGGVVGVVEVRLNEPEGHDMESHRVGEQTVIDDFESAGFEYEGESDILRRDDDDYAVYMVEGKSRYQTDRMLLKFRKPAN
jgi:predicted methyltransferase